MTHFEKLSFCNMASTTLFLHESCFILTVVALPQNISLKNEKMKIGKWQFHWPHPTKSRVLLGVSKTVYLQTKN